MTISKTSAYLLAASLALTGATAFAQSSASTSSSEDYAPPPVPVQSGAPVSTNSTGKTSGSGTTREITVEQFTAVDTDSDGRISLNEFIASPVLGSNASSDATARSSISGTPRSDETTKVDADVRGRNTPELFRQLDKNEDGFLSATEIAAFYQVDITDSTP
jgi:hypothetical protein